MHHECMQIRSDKLIAPVCVRMIMLFTYDPSMMILIFGLFRKYQLKISSCFQLTLSETMPPYVIYLYDSLFFMSLNRRLYYRCYRHILHRRTFQNVRLCVSLQHFIEFPLSVYSTACARQ